VVQADDLVLHDLTRRERALHGSVLDSQVGAVGPGRVPCRRERQLAAELRQLQTDQLQRGRVRGDREAPMVVQHDALGAGGEHRLVQLALLIGHLHGETTFDDARHDGERRHRDHREEQLRGQRELERVVGAERAEPGRRAGGVADGHGHHGQGRPSRTQARCGPEQPDDRHPREREVRRAAERHPQQDGEEAELDAGLGAAPAPDGDVLVRAPERGVTGPQQQHERCDDEDPGEVRCHPGHDELVELVADRRLHGERRDDHAGTDACDRRAGEAGHERGRPGPAPARGDERTADHDRLDEVRHHQARRRSHVMARGVDRDERGGDGCRGEDHGAPALRGPRQHHRTGADTRRRPEHGERRPLGAQREPEQPGRDVRGERRERGADHARPSAHRVSDLRFPRRFGLLGGFGERLAQRRVHEQALDDVAHLEVRGDRQRDDRDQLGGVTPHDRTTEHDAGGRVRDDLDEAT
jgi:hypothetical protein